MFSSRNIPLVTYVRRTLVMRLAFMATVIALVLAVLAFVAEERIMEEAVVSEAQADLEELTELTREFITQKGAQPVAAFRQAMDEFASSKRRDKRGKIVYASFSKPGYPDKEEYLDRSYVLHQAVWDHMHSGRRSVPETEDLWSETVFIAEVLSVHAVLPFGETGKKDTGRAEIVFVPAPSVLAAMQRKTYFSVAVVMFITLATTGLLYPVILRLTNRLVTFSRNLQAANFETLSMLGCVVAKRDSDTDEHNYRVTLYALRMAEAMDLDADDMRALTKGAFLHDVGKIAIRDSILLKPGTLTPDEYEVMKTHVRHGLEVVSRSSWLRDARAVVGGHHEKFDGNGYPRGLAGDEIPLTARIFTVADVFDALTSRRPYKEALSCDEALGILRHGSGKHFDPEIVDIFGGMAAALHERYAHRNDRDLSAELIDLAWRYFHADAETLVR
jgi:HD-GYP domain-containing protein (c-di-GMP phosphodiesterase class II)